MSEETRLARLKKHDPRRGFVLRRYVYRGIKFQDGRGWLRVDPETARYLESVHQIAGVSHSPKAFDICTDAEAKKLEEREAREGHATLATDAVRTAEPRVPADGPPLTTALDKRKKKT